MEKQKKPFYKKIWFWVLAVIVVSAVGANGEDTPKEEATTAVKTEEVKADDTEKAEPAKEEKKAEPKKEVNDPEMTKAEFNKLRNGMTYEEVIKIVGGEGELSSEVGAVGDDLYTAMYTFEGNSFGGNANLTFQGSPAKLNMKAQFGLK